MMTDSNTNNNNEVRQLLQGLLRTLRQPDLDSTRDAKTRLAQSVTEGSLTPFQIHQELLAQAVQSIPVNGYIMGTATEGFVSTGPPAGPGTLSVPDAIVQIVAQGIDTVVPGIEWTELSSDDLTTMAPLYALVLAAYRRADDMRSFLETLLVLQDDNHPNLLLTELVDGNHDRLGSPLRLAARVGAKQCVELLLQLGHANPNQRHGPSYAHYTTSILVAVLQVLQHDLVNPTQAVGAAEPVDYPGVMTALLKGGAQVHLVEAQQAMQIPNNHRAILEQLLQAGLENETLTLDDDLVALAPTAIFMDAKEQKEESSSTTQVSRLALLLPHGVDPNETIADLVVPWTTSGGESPEKVTSLLEIAIQANDVRGLQALLETGASLLDSGVLDRVLTTALSEAMLYALDNALELELSNKVTKQQVLQISPPTLSIHSGMAWVGNVPDFQTYIRNKINPPKYPKLDDQFLAARKKREALRASRTNDKVEFPDLPAQTGDWIVVTPLPTLQLVFHVDCPEDYLLGAITGAMYGGFTDGAWNPLMPPEKEMYFTGRMTFSEEDPRHVTWFMDAVPVDDGSSADDTSPVVEAMKDVAVPDASVLERLQSVSLVGTWQSNNDNPQQTAAMWTCRQEYRYGIMAGSQAFISIGYEAMDLPAEKVATVLDTVLRAKHHYHHPDASAAPFFHRTRFSTSHADYVAQVPKKRTPAEIFEHNVTNGAKYTGLDDWWGEIPPKEETRRFSPDDRIYNPETINAMLQHKFNVSMARGLEEDVTLLIDELVMMFLHTMIVPGVVKIAKDAAGEITVDTLSNQLADEGFSNDKSKDGINYHCFKRLTKLDEEANEGSQQGESASPPDDCLAPENAAALKDRIGVFLKKHVLTAEQSIENSRAMPLITEADFLERILSVCQFLVHEVLELSNNGRRDSNLPSIVPRHVRSSVSGDTELEEAFSSNLVMEFYYPAHQKQDEE
ncbi:expressed unknown protein [Seminavis robusta]|uniref:Uncharacterized protein n=1 Tax=Seminavis robusta TaxID=568900 RepID=A0A9N8HBK8_9STRA|nr:expressed unknown protein [Seminavis robusta]|eukprot:Sro367_g127750.1 n/a (961) ;mRNA; f:23597-26479